MLSIEQILFFKHNGYLIVNDILDSKEIISYRRLYEDFLSNKIDVSKYRSDLGSHIQNNKNDKKELITQIMVPSRVLPDLLARSMHKMTLELAKRLLGSDMELDFDMLIDKAPHTNTATPWHQDCAYWVDMPDKRAVSCWVALDDTTKDNGCMWYVPKSHLNPVRPHKSAGKGGGALECYGSEGEAIAAEVSAGTCILHHGGTVHYARGNSTNKRRRAFITNYRPKAMIEFERKLGFDHTQERKVRDQQAKD